MVPVVQGDEIILEIDGFESIFLSVY